TEVAEDQGVEDMIAFATSAIREAPNGDDVLARVRAETGVDLQALSGSDEATLTFLAARRWGGWSGGGAGGRGRRGSTGCPTSPCGCRWVPGGSPATGCTATRRPPTRCAPRAG